MSMAFPQDAKVRFTQERLSLLTPRDRQGLAGRIGVIQVDKNCIRKPTVYFPADGAKLELRLFRVDPRHLELVEAPPERIAAPPSLNEGENHADLTQGTVDVVETPAPEGGGNLSQSDLDSFFD